jgi:hypothetical protein
MLGRRDRSRTRRSNRGGIGGARPVRLVRIARDGRGPVEIVNRLAGRTRGRRAGGSRSAASSRGRARTWPDGSRDGATNPACRLRVGERSGLAATTKNFSQATSRSPALLGLIPSGPSALREKRARRRPGLRRKWRRDRTPDRSSVRVQRSPGAESQPAVQTGEDSRGTFPDPDVQGRSGLGNIPNDALAAERGTFPFWGGGNVPARRGAGSIGTFPCAGRRPPGFFHRRGRFGALSTVGRPKGSLGIRPRPRAPPPRRSRPRSPLHPPGAPLRSRVAAAPSAPHRG